MGDYNYQTFDMAREMPVFQEFRHNLHAGERAPDGEAEDLATGESVSLKQLWRAGPVIIEFGSFT